MTHQTVHFKIVIGVNGVHARKNPLQTFLMTVQDQPFEVLQRTFGPHKDLIPAFTPNSNQPHQVGKKSSRKRLVRAYGPKARSKTIQQTTSGWLDKLALWNRSLEGPSDLLSPNTHTLTDAQTDSLHCSKANRAGLLPISEISREAQAVINVSHGWLLLFHNTLDNQLVS